MMKIRFSGLDRLYISFCVILLATLFLLASGAFVPVSAHFVQPIKTDPADGVQLTQSPAVVRAWFPEEALAEESSLKVFDSQGKQVDSGRGGVDLNDTSHEVMSVALPSLGEGVYTVVWKVGMLDGDSAEGSFKFGVGNVIVPTTAPAPTESSTVTAISDPTIAPFNLPIGWILTAAAVMVLVLVSIYLLIQAGGR